MGEGEVTGDRMAGMRLVGEPTVDRADAFSDDQSDTAELPRFAALFPGPPFGGIDRLVAPPGSGVLGWSVRLRAVLLGCGAPLILVALLCAAPMQLFSARVSDTVVAAPVLSDLAGGVGLLLLPLMWLSYLALAALPVVLCLAGVVGVVVAWAPDDSPPGLRAVLSGAAHRLGPLWAWLATLGAVTQARSLIPADAAGPRAGVALSVGAAALSAVLAALLGVLGCVVLFERRRGPRRALRLLAVSPAGAVIALGAIGVALAVLPPVTDAAWGPLAASLVAVGCALMWAVAALVTYAQARRAEGPLTSAQLRRELSA